MSPYYSDDSCVIYHGDCREILPSVSGVNVTVTSPPYNTLGSRIPTTGSGLMKDRKAWLAKVNDEGYADDLDETDYALWQVGVAAAIREVTLPGGSFFYNHKIRYRDRTPVHPLDLVRGFVGWSLRQEIVWSRPSSMVLNARMFPPSDERIYWLYRPDGDFRWNLEANAWRSVWTISPVSDVNSGHPCPYPLSIPKRCIIATTLPGDLVLDPFMGSGTTLRAAKDLGRRAIGIDVSEAYCEIAAKRLAQEVLAL